MATNLFWFWLLDLTASLIKVVAAPLLYRIQVGVRVQVWGLGFIARVQALAFWVEVLRFRVSDFCYGWGLLWF